MYSKRTKVFEEFTKGTNKILVTASAVIGSLTIKNLNLLVIPNNPFAQPTNLEKWHRANIQNIKRSLIVG